MARRSEYDSLNALLHLFEHLPPVVKLPGIGMPRRHFDRRDESGALLFASTPVHVADRNDIVTAQLLESSISIAAGDPDEGGVHLVGGRQCLVLGESCNGSAGRRGQERSPRSATAAFISSFCHCVLCIWHCGTVSPSRLYS